MRLIKELCANNDDISLIQCCVRNLKIDEQYLHTDNIGEEVNKISQEEV